MTKTKAAAPAAEQTTLPASAKIGFVRMVPLSALEPGKAINARIEKPSKEDDDALSNSVAKIGLILPLAVRETAADRYAVIDGNRRLAALVALAKAGRIPTDMQVPVMDHQQIDIAGALEMSLAANMERLDLHEVDRYETFAELVRHGRTPAQIASRFILTPRQVDRALALGKLSPLIRSKWREGKIDEEAARVFALAAGDFARQDRVFASLSKGGGLNSWTIRKALVGDRHEADKLIAFVGIEDYRAAGGAITEDLFSDKEKDSAIPTDLALLKKLFDEKLVKKAEDIKRAGWKWVDLATDMPQSWSYSYERLTQKGGKWTDAQMERSGVVLQFDFNGTFSAVYGVVKPADKKATDKKKAAAKGVEIGPAISNALVQRLSETLTWATADVLQSDITIALPAILAGFASQDKIVDVREHGLKMKKEGDSGRGEIMFANSFKSVSRLDRQGQLEILAKVASRALDFQVQSAEHPPLDDPAIAALCGALNAEAMTKALEKYFDPKDYFEHVPKALIVKAVAETLGKGHADKVAKMKTAEACKFALNNVPKTWLPEQLRWAGYAGPGPKARRGK